MSNADGRQTGLIYPNEEVEIYMGREQSIKIFTGLADTIITSVDGLSFEAYDNLSLLAQEYITEEYQSEWRDTDVGVIIRAIIESSKWAPTAKYVRTDTDVIIGQVNYRWMSRLEALRKCLEMANSGEKRYTIFCDGAGDIHFRRYDDDTFVVAHITTESEMDHIIEDLNGNDTRMLLFFTEGHIDGVNKYTDDYSAYENDCLISDPSPSGRHRTKGWSYKFNGTTDYGAIGSDASLDIFSGQTFTIDVVFFPVTLEATNGAYLFINTNNKFDIRVKPTGTIIGIYTDNVTPRWVWSSSIGWDTGQWNHLTLVVNGSSIKLYKNGILVDSTTQSSDNWVGSGSEGFYIAMDVDAPNYPLDGYMDMMRFSNKAYSPEEIYNYTRIQSSDIILEDIQKVEMGGEKYNHCIVKYSDDIWAQYPDPCPNDPRTKFITTTSERTKHDCYIRAKAIVLSHTRVPTQYKATAYSSRCDYRPNDLVEIYAPRYNIVGNFRLKNMTYTIRDGVRKMSVTLNEEAKQLTQLLAIAGL
jgi:hypothetical protein